MRSAQRSRYRARSARSRIALRTAVFRCGRVSPVAPRRSHSPRGQRPGRRRLPEVRPGRSHHRRRSTAARRCPTPRPVFRTPSPRRRPFRTTRSQRSTEQGQRRPSARTSGMSSTSPRNSVRVATPCDFAICLSLSSKRPDSSQAKSCRPQSRMSECLDRFADALAVDKPRRATDHEVTVGSSRLRVACGWRETLEIDAVRDAHHAGPRVTGRDPVLHVRGHRD